VAAIDFNRHSDFDSARFDIVIVGAGAAGLYLAALLAPRMRVLVLESGHWTVDDDRQALNEVDHRGRVFDSVGTRRRVIGGTTVAWGGQSLPFAPIDFDEWPFGLQELERHYRAANEAMGIDPRPYGAETLQMLSVEAPAFDPEKVWFHTSKWAPEPNFRRIFRKEIDRDFTILYNAQFVDAEILDGRIVAVEVSNFGAQVRRLPCSRLVVAAGGLETNRIIAWLQEQHRFLRPSQQEILGTGYMDHPALRAGFVDPVDPYMFQKTFNTQIRSGRKYSLRLSTPEAWMREEGWLNVSASFMMVGREDGFNPYAEFAGFSHLWRSSPTRLAASLLSVAATAGALMRDKFVYKRGLRVAIGVMAEQEASSTSRITLSRQRDRFGVPKLLANWDISPRTWQSVAAFCRVVKSEVERLGFGSVHLRPELESDGEDRTDLFTDSCHHMGGTVLGADSSRSVVDENLRVRNVANLWIASSSVFPTGSHSNPTLTVLALVHRLAERIGASLARS
jgi:choline dehydrogenase-like flavoprotein